MNATGYLWNFGDGTTSAETNPTHIYSSDDTYAVTLTAYGECDTVVTNITAVTVKGTGMESLNQGESVSIFPNPSNGIFNLTSVLNQEGNAVISIFDMNGKLIHNENLGKIGKQNTRTIQVSVAPGVYTLRLNTQDRSITRKLVIK
jgi:PKD repeat protein